jgi:[ribosomal protein S5]-alanine N-acetyltransferase
MQIPFFEGKLRTWRNDDAVALARYANNRKIWLNVHDKFPFPYTISDAIKWIDFAKRHSESEFAIASSSEAIGGMRLHIQEDIRHRTAEIGYWLGEPFWGKGITTSAVNALVNYAFNSFDLVRIHAFVFEWNLASARVLEKSGFHLEARLEISVTKDGKTVDCLLYALIRDKHKEG